MRKIALLTIALLAIVAWAGWAHAECAVGNKAKVEWKGSWYSAKVLKVKGDQSYIHYDGYGKNWDEWVGPERIKCGGGAEPVAASGKSFSVGDPVQVNWKGSWYPAHVIATNKAGTSWKIHYDGYNNSWDEWVGSARIKQ